MSLDVMSWPLRECKLSQNDVELLQHDIKKSLKKFSSDYTTKM